jgi:hypothetical protein
MKAGDFRIPQTYCIGFEPPDKPVTLNATRQPAIR